jgi:hypothetical protein
MKICAGPRRSGAAATGVWASPVGGILLLIAAVRIWLHDGYGAIELVLGAAGLCLIVTCSRRDPSVAMRVRHQETDDEKQPVQREADHRRAA